MNWVWVAAAIVCVVGLVELIRAELLDLFRKYYPSEWEE